MWGSDGETVDAGPFQDRTITVREAARLQSFRDSFGFPQNFISKHYEQIGNAVPPLVAKLIGQALKRHLHHGRRRGAAPEMEVAA